MGSHKTTSLFGHVAVLKVFQETTQDQDTGCLLGCWGITEVEDWKIEKKWDNAYLSYWDNPYLLPFKPLFVLSFNYSVDKYDMT